MSSRSDEATYSLLRDSLNVSTHKRILFNKRLFNNKGGFVRFIIKSLLLIGGLAIFGTLLIFVYDTVKIPKYNSIFYDSNYVCHDSITCGKKYHENYHNDDNSNTPKTAFFSSLYSDNYLKGALLLGYTIKKHHPNHEMYLLYLPDKLSLSTICQAQSIGWIMKPAERIPSPWKVYKGYADQYTKLRLWTFTEFKDGIIYLDSDTIVLKNLANLFELIKPSTGFEFAAASDFLHGDFLYTFNAGFMLFKPNIDVYNELMRIYNTTEYNHGYAEQGFLNEFYRYRYLKLPETYNINLAMVKAFPHLWKALLPDMNVVHYTIRKPFLVPNAGIYTEPYELWNNLFKEMDENVNVTKLESECK